MVRLHPAPLRRSILYLAAAVWLWPLAARAHEGPPFPVLTDHVVGPYRVSVWTDPDIGVGTFYVILEPAAGGVMPPVERVVLTAAPVSGRLKEAAYEATAQDARHGARFYGEVAFDRQEPWRVEVDIDGAGGGGSVGVEVTPTPDGTIGPIGLLLYALPFLAVGFLWLKAVLRRREARRRTVPEEARRPG